MTKKLRALFGANLKACRRERGITQAELAEKIDRSVNLVSQIERGKNAPSFDSIVMICEVLSVAPDDLFRGWETLTKGKSSKYLEIQASLAKLSDDELLRVQGILEAVLAK